jgi:hypothetical protein
MSVMMMQGNHKGAIMIWFKKHLNWTWIISIILLGIILLPFKHVSSELRRGDDLNLHTTVWQDMTPWKEEIGEQPTLGGILQMLAEIFLPYVTLMIYWGNLPANQRVTFGILDTLSLIILALIGVLIILTKRRNILWIFLLVIWSPLWIANRTNKTVQLK